MKSTSRLLIIAAFSLGFLHAAAQENIMNADDSKGKKNLYIDVHRLPPGTVKYDEVAKAHALDLQVEKKYGVEFIKYWVDEQKGLIYCLSSASDSPSIRKTHAEAHGLLPAQIYQVTDGQETTSVNQDNFFLDIHQFGVGKVTANDVAAAHKKDLAVQKKYGVKFINYWVDEKTGVVFCLSQAKDSGAVVSTHKEAHGLIPVEVLKIKQGQ